MIHSSRQGDPLQRRVSIWNRFEPTTFRPANEIVNAFNAVKQTPGPTRQVLPGGTASMLTACQFQLTAMAGDYFEAKVYDGTTQTGSAIKIAKPFQLRRTPFDGETITELGISYVYNSDTTRTATLDEEDEEQLVIPKYLVGFSVIFAIKPIVGGTGVTWDNMGQDVPVEWLDLNVDARAWAREA